MDRTAKRYLIASGALLVFGLGYECFSHGVWSPFMWGAFLLPLLGGFLPAALPRRSRPGEAARWLWGAGLTTLTAGSLFRGVLEIYGTASRLGAVYWVVGGALLLAALACRLWISGKARPHP